MRFHDAYEGARPFGGLCSDQGGRMRLREGSEQLRLSDPINMGAWQRSAQCPHAPRSDGQSPILTPSTEAEPLAGETPFRVITDRTASGGSGGGSWVTWFRVGSFEPAPRRRRGGWNGGAGCTKTAPV